MNDVIRTINNHRSIRKFKNIPLTQEQIDIIVRAAQMAPTSGHLQSFTIIGITDPNLKKELSKRAESPAIEESGYLFIFCVDFYRIMVTANDIEKEKMKNNLSFAYFYQTGITNTAIALQNANLAAESIGLGTVILGGVGAVTELDEWLDLPNNVIPLVGLAVGVPNEMPEQKPRLPQSALFFENKYNRHLKELVEKFDKDMEYYYAHRTSNQQIANWSQKNINMLTQDIPFEFYSEYIKRKGFVLK
ncbi:nitroreductase family protein [Thermaerobacillus caldiproteolyticus]|uniref:FMN reductase (NADPH) n=1 Tax=Thermaerobacillus caldiproteolyticus TaxID=247480 RepID=A0A7V9Z8Z3_9BACL|nr:nitroreductase family protein [Anoxybacillus caldiproteolyticus]MBA2876232.1 FMN reductase (NADPH) [Anoxybacillus caldiproteolyticus]